MLTTLSWSLEREPEYLSGILAMAERLIGGVKSVPISRRSNFPQIFKNNNFGYSLLGTDTHTFLEVDVKSKARSTTQERLHRYQQCFCSLGSPLEPAIAYGPGARHNTIATLGLEGHYAIGLGGDMSLTAWDVMCLTLPRPGKKIPTEFKLLFIVGYGQRIPKQAAELEFESMIRVALANWIKP